MMVSGSTSLRQKLPRPIRLAGAAVLSYLGRLRRWISVLGHLRGVSWLDQFKLLLSAAAAPVISIAKPFEWRNPEPLWDLDVESRGIGKFSVRKGTDDLYHILPSREPELLQQMKSRLGEGATFVDAGANIGVYSVLSSKLVGPSGRVKAVEMIPATAELLRRNLQFNGCANVEIVNKALSARSGQRLTARMPLGKAGMASIAVDHSGAEVTLFEVDTVTLDDALADVAQIDLMKMDLEGAEPVALQGAEKTLEKTCAIIFEANSDNGQTKAILKAAGFDVSALDGKDMLALKVASESHA